MDGMNGFRIAADLSHALSKCILMFAIHINRSAEGVSLITQALYALVFCTRYVDLFTVPPNYSYWNFIFKIFYIASSFYILCLMLRVFARTREREAAWKLGAYCLAGSIVLAPILNLIIRDSEHNRHGLRQMLIDFSLILESVAVLPQLLLLRQTTVPTVIDSFYLLALGSYRALYILNWIQREFENDHFKPDPISVTFGIVQTALYIDFAWVYWTRQRIKLRRGGVVDVDDLSRGWLLSKILGRPSMHEEEEDEERRPALDGADEDRAHPDNGPKNNWGSKWGSRGISVKADDGTLGIESQSQRLGDEEDDPIDAPDARMRDPDELARALEEEEDDDDDGVLPSQKDSDARPRSGSGGIGNGDEWSQ